MELKRVRREEFAEIWLRMCAAFDRTERRDEAAARALADEPRYALYFLVEEGRRVGFVSVWELEGFAFVEHFAVDETLRGHGYGGSAIECVLARYPLVVLEIELPVSGLPRRRYSFYASHGFRLCDAAYVQPPYRDGGEEVPMWLLSSAPVADASSIAATLRREVYGY